MFSGIFFPVLSFWFFSFLGSLVFDPKDLARSPKRIYSEIFSFSVHFSLLVTNKTNPLAKHHSSHLRVVYLDVAASSFDRVAWGREDQSGIFAEGEAPSTSSGSEVVTTVLSLVDLD